MPRSIKYDQHIRSKFLFIFFNCFRKRRRSQFFFKVHNNFHVVVWLDLAGHCPIKEVEIYCAGRYFTVTGQALPGTPSEVAECSMVTLGALLEELLRARVERERTAEAEASGKVERARRRRAELTASGFETSDRDLLSRARRAKSGERFIQLFDKGDLSRYDGDHSRADLALCKMLAFWTGGDPDRVDQLLRVSSLFRDKWERDDYRTATIEEAIR